MVATWSLSFDLENLELILIIELDFIMVIGEIREQGGLRPVGMDRQRRVLRVRRYALASGSPTVDVWVKAYKRLPRFGYVSHPIVTTPPNHGKHIYTHAPSLSFSEKPNPIIIIIIILLLAILTFLLFFPKEILTFQNAN